MEIVIKINDDYYNLIKRDADKGDYLNVLERAVINGTPLPKGHGRIADMDEAIKCIEEVTGDDAVYAISLIEWACSKRTIIEADRSEE